MAGKPEARSTVLLAWPDLFPANHAGAVRGLALASTIEKLGYLCLIVTSAAQEQSVRLSERCRVHTLVMYDQYAQFLPPPMPAALLPLTVARLALLAKRSDAKVIISSTPGLFLSLESYFVARLLRLRFVFDVRDSWNLETVTHQGKLRNFVKHWIEGVLCRGSFITWTVTESLAKLIEQSHRAARGQIIVVPNGADRSKFGPGREPKEYDFVFLGSPSPYRDIPRVLRGLETFAARVPSLRGLWLGWHEPSVEREDLVRLNRLVDNGVLTLNSPVAHEGVPALLQKARIGLVSLSPQDVFRTAVGAKVYEYIATGLPVLCLGPPGDSELRRFIEAGGFGFYTTSPEEFGERGAEVLNDRDLLDEFSANCLASASQYDRSTVFREALTTHSILPSGVP